MSDTDDYLRTIAETVKRQSDREAKRDRDADLQGAAARERADQAMDHLQTFSGMAPVVTEPSDWLLVLLGGMGGIGANGGIAVAWASDTSFGAWQTVVRLAKEAYGGGRSFVVSSGASIPDIAISYRDPLSGQLGAIYASVLASVTAICPRSKADPGGTAVIVPR